MGHWGKIVGGGIGAVFGGPLGAGIGALIGNVFDDDEPSGSASTDAPPFGGECAWGCGWSPDGPSLVLNVTVTEGGIPEGAFGVLMVRDADSGHWARGALEDFRDEDGDVQAVAAVKTQDGQRFVRFVLPFAAFEAPAPRNVSARVVLQDPSGSPRINEWTMEMPDAARRNTDNLGYALCMACVAMFRTDGPLEKHQVRALRVRLTEEFELTKPGVASLKPIIKAADEAVPSVAACVDAAAREGLPGSALLAFVRSVAEAAGGGTPGGEQFLRSLAAAFGVAEPASERPEDALRDHYATLELEPGATLQQVKSAYRRLIAEYHPDKVHNLPRGFQEYATKRTAELNTAYQALCAALRG